MHMNIQAPGVDVFDTVKAPHLKQSGSPLCTPKNLVCEGCNPKGKWLSWSGRIRYGRASIYCGVEWTYSIIPGVDVFDNSWIIQPQDVF